MADEMGYSPVMLNRLVPQLTHRMVEKIFASDLEDWPAILRAMQETGDEFRQGKIASLAGGEPASRLKSQRYWFASATDPSGGTGDGHTQVTQQW